MEEELLINNKKTSLSDQQIITGLIDEKDERRKAFYQKQFYNRYVNYVFKGAIQLSRNFVDAEELAKDITQETFIRAFKVINKFTFKVGVDVSEHSFILKSWLGVIANNSFKTIYQKHINEVSIEKEQTDFEEVVCPICGDFLFEEKKNLKCQKGHYKISVETRLTAQPIKESVGTDLFDSLYREPEIEISNRFKNKLQNAMNLLSEKQKHIILVYANEGCIDSRLHLSDMSLKELCTIYETTPDNIKHIKKRTLDKIKKICFTP